MKKKIILIATLIIMIAMLTAFSMFYPEKEKGDRLVVTLGDSLTYGYGDQEGSGYIDTLQTRLNSEHIEDYNFDNEAIYGLESSGIFQPMTCLKEKIRNSFSVIHCI